MTLRLLSYIAALGLAFCFVAIGERILGRRCGQLADWNFSFITGLSFTSTFFFPLSLALPANALNATLFSVLLVGVLRFSSRLPAVAQPLPSKASQHGWGYYSLLALVVFLSIQFTVYNYRLPYLWDGYQIWATKARVLYERGALTPDMMMPPDTLLREFPNCCDGIERVAGYPHLLPLFQALLAKIWGVFMWESLKAVFPIFFVSLLISTFSSARVLVPRGPALAACALVALLPALSSGHNIGGYADMPQAALVAAFCAAVVSAASDHRQRWRHAAPWALAGMLLVKSEGVILFGIVGVVTLIVWLSAGQKRFILMVRRYAGFIAVAGAGALFRVSYLLWIETKDLTYGPIDRRHIAVAWSRLWEVPTVCAHFMLNLGEWGLFWPLFFAAVPVIARKGRLKETAIMVGTVLAIASYTGIFYFTNWDVRLHIEQAYTRLLTHLAPSAAICIVLSYHLIVRGKAADRSIEVLNTCNSAGTDRGTIR